MHKKILSFSFLLPFLSNIAFANCPQPQTISYQCHMIKGRNICTWGPDNGWYQGNSDENPVKDGERLSPNAFTQAVWFPYNDDSHGATSCYYKGPYGETVNLFQQTGYGTVPPPVGSLWTKIRWEGFPYALSCSSSAFACKFEFGEKT